MTRDSKDNGTVKVIKEDKPSLSLSSTELPVPSDDVVQRNKEHSKDRHHRSHRDKDKPTEKKKKRTPSPSREASESEDTEVDTATDDETSDDETASDSDDDGSDASDADDASMTSTELLNNDPLFFVLKNVLVSKEGRNIADILEDINLKLGKLVKF